MKKRKIKTLLLTLLLFMIVLLGIYSLIGIYISGPYFMSQNEQSKIEILIKEKEEDIVSLTRKSFEFVTYTCETKKDFIIYDENGKKIITRSKKDVQLEKVKKIIEKDYPSLIGKQIDVGYGYDNIAYLIEYQDELLVLDFDTLKEIFYMKEEI